MNLAEIGKKLAGIGLPLLGGALGGPGGAVVGKMVAGALGLSDADHPADIDAALANIDGEQLVRLRQIEADLAKEHLRSDTQLAQGQIELNTLYARRSEFWHSGGRPAALWICVTGLGYTFLLRPLAPWLLTVVGVEGVPALPALDTGELLALLGGLLGLGTMRSVERVKDRA